MQALNLVPEQVDFALRQMIMPAARSQAQYSQVYHNKNIHW